MSESENQIEKMHARLEKMAAREQLLISALNEALSAADRKLLDEVRGVTADHEARRAIIMSELQTLAERVGAFPVSEMAIETIEYEAPATAQPIGELTAPEEAPAQGGDWRKAAKKITDGLDFHFKGAAPQQPASQSS